MAITSLAKRLPGYPHATFELGRHVIIDGYRVQTDSYADGPIVVTSTAAGIPELFSPYSTANEAHAGARLRAINPRRVHPNSTTWIVECRYETAEAVAGGGTGAGGSTGNSGGAGGGTKSEIDGQHQDPILELPDLSMHTEMFQRPVDLAFEKISKFPRAPQNSAGEVFDPPAMMDDSRLVLTISRNEAITAPHPETALLYTDKVNSDVWWFAQPGQAKVMSITTQRQTKQLPNGTTFPYLRVTYVLHFRTTWDLELLDQGNYWIDASMDPANTRKHRFKDEDGHPRKGLLDGEGGKLADDAEPVYITLEIYKRAPFATLNLPTSWLDFR